jgi:hypothetical protein
LEIKKTGHLLSCDNADGHTDLLNWQGEMLYSAPEKHSFYCYSAEDGYLLATSTDLTVVFSPAGEFVRSLPYKISRLVSGHPGVHMAKVRDKVLNRDFWVDYLSGRVYRNAN